METPIHSIVSLFEQLGLDSTGEEIDAFITTNGPLAGSVELYKADFWNTSQACFLKQMKDEDADWAGIVDQLDVMLRRRHTCYAHMKDLPTAVLSYKRTPVFTNETVPKGLLRAHQTKAGTWGKIVVLQGELRYRILEPEVEEFDLSPSNCGIVEPTVLHEVEPLNQVRFYVEFYR